MARKKTLGSIAHKGLGVVLAPYHIGKFLFARPSCNRPPHFTPREYFSDAVPPFHFLKQAGKGMLWSALTSLGVANVLYYYGGSEVYETAKMISVSGIATGVFGNLASLVYESHRWDSIDEENHELASCGEDMVYSALGHLDSRLGGDVDKNKGFDPERFGDIDDSQSTDRDENRWYDSHGYDGFLPPPPLS